MGAVYRVPAADRLKLSPVSHLRSRGRTDVIIGK